MLNRYPHAKCTHTPTYTRANPKYITVTRVSAGFDSDLLLMYAACGEHEPTLESQRRQSEIVNQCGRKCHKACNADHIFCRNEQCNVQTMRKQQSVSVFVQG